MGGAIAVESRPQDDAPEALDSLRSEVAALRASRERLVRAADANLRSIERELHRGVQQHLVAFSMRLQLVEASIDSDPDAAKALLAELSRDVQDAVDEAGRLAQRIHVPLLEVGLAAALRAAAAGAGVRAFVDVSAGSHSSAEALQTLYAAWLDALARAGDRAPSIAVREDGQALLFELICEPSPEAALDTLRDRVEALGGALTVL